MMSVRSITLLLACSLMTRSALGSSLRTIDNDDAFSLGAKNLQLFQTWATTHSKDYTTDDDKAERMKIWMDNHGEFSCLLCRYMIASELIADQDIEESLFTHTSLYFYFVPFLFCF